MSKYKSVVECSHCHCKQEVVGYIPTEHTRSLLSHFENEVGLKIDLETYEDMACYLDEITEKEAEECIEYGIKYAKKYGAIAIDICQNCYLPFIPHKSIKEKFCYRRIG